MNVCLYQMSGVENIIVLVFVLKLRRGTYTRIKNKRKCIKVKSLAHRLMLIDVMY